MARSTLASIMNGTFEKRRIAFSYYIQRHEYENIAKTSFQITFSQDMSHKNFSIIQMCMEKSVCRYTPIQCNNCRFRNKIFGGTMTISYPFSKKKITYCSSLVHVKLLHTKQKNIYSCVNI